MSPVDPAQVALVVAREYEIGTPDSCRLVYAGHNDTYEVVVGNRRYAFRVQSAKWWKHGESDARFELDLLTHLHRHDVPVVYPIPRGNGDSLGVIRTTSADRFYSLFNWAAGATVDDRDLTPDHTYLVGRTMASIHAASDYLETTHSRYLLDEQTLLDRSLAELAEQLAESAADDVATIEYYAADIRTRLHDFDPGPTGWGIVHGDIYWANLHFNGPGNITVFDFDLCGYGWRAYDLAYYYTRVPGAVRAAALDGYESVRPLADAERDMLTTFGRLAWIRADGRPMSRLAELLRDPYV